MLSAEEILQSPLKDGFRVVCCPVCYRENIVKPTTARGDPRNIAYIGHWDGWQPFNNSSHSCGTVSVSAATMSKTQRSHSNQVFVVGFVPTYLLPKRKVISMDPFWHHFALKLWMDTLTV
jgi:hypothetical protein